MTGIWQLLLAAATLAVPVGTPAAFDVAGRPVVRAVHAFGAQIYQCKQGPDGTATWVQREPIATLVAADVTVGRHYAGPVWLFDDGARVTGRTIASAPGATANDVPLLKLAVIRTSGPLAGVTLILRLATRGGMLTGGCATPGMLRPVAYSAEYLFLR